MINMTQRKPDSATPAGELARDRRSLGHDPRRNQSLDFQKESGPLTCGHEQRTNVNGHKCRGWSGGVVGDRRVGNVDEISRETHRD